MAPLLRPHRLLLRALAHLSTPAGRVCIVGSGPAAFYTAQCLLKGAPGLHVDLLEALPVPFGLVRYGVAPDHPEVKNVTNQFTATARNPRVRFFGNVRVGQDVGIEQLRAAYNAVVLAYGAAQDRTLDIPGESLPGVLAATDLVGWYNGLPQCSSLQPDLSADTAAVIGLGNVALDVARILLAPIDLLRSTDIPEPVLATLAASRVRKVVLVGRRGPAQVAFTIKEVRELLRLPDCGYDLSHVKEACPQLSPEALQKMARPRRRLTELLLSSAASPVVNRDRQWSIRFLRSPEEIIADPDGKVSGLQLRINEYTDPSQSLTSDASVSASSHSEHLPCGLVVRSVGYRSVRIDPAVPWDAVGGRVPNKRGHVVGNLFCAGWIKRGPTGVLLSTLADGKETGSELVRMWSEGCLSEGNEDAVKSLLSPLLHKTTSFEDWERMDTIETSRGVEMGKSREKITSLDEMLDHRKPT